MTLEACFLQTLLLIGVAVAVVLLFQMLHIPSSPADALARTETRIQR